MLLLLRWLLLLWLLLLFLLVAAAPKVVGYSRVVLGRHRRSASWSFREFDNLEFRGTSYVQ